MHSPIHSNIAAYLKERGIRPSIQRVAVMRYMMQHRTHPTADEIFSYLSELYPSLSRTTVYNTLALLSASGVIKTLCIDNTYTRYDFAELPHGHFRCSQCGKIIDVCLSEPPHPIIPPGVGSINLNDVIYSGLCSDCSTKKD